MVKQKLSKTVPEPHKCLVKYGVLTPCSLLAGMLQKSGQGFRLNEYLSMAGKSKVGHASVNLKSCVVSYHKSFGKGGLVLNFCLHCGVDIASHMEKRKG
jgi:hypothetical protein